MKKLFAMLIALMMLVSLCSTAFAEGEDVTITLVRTGTPEVLHNIFEPLIEQFEAEHPNIKVDMQDLGWADATQSIQTWASSDSLPDVMYHLPGTIFNLATMDKIRDLTPYMDEELKEDMFSSMLEAGQFDGKQYMIICSASSLLLWYNVALFEQAGLDPDAPPTTWSELLDACEALSKLDGIRPLSIYSSPGGGETSFMFESLFTTEYGGSAWNAETNSYVYDTEEGKDAAINTLQFIQDLTAYAQDNYVEYGRFDCRTLLANGDVAMAIDLINMANQIPDQLADGSMRCALLPAGASGVQSTAINCGGWYIPANCEHPDEAWELLRFLMTTDSQLAHAKYGSVPVLKSEAATYTDGYMAVVASSLANSYAEGICPDTNALWEVTGEQLQLLLLGDQTAEETWEYISEGHADILG